uniref:Uncharacterized protein n=1 Tax=Oryza glaberrima TaxID=4538 RepID=I1PED6_ORYGL
MARARLRVAAGSFLEREGETRRTRLVGSISFVVDELKSVDEQSFLDGHGEPYWYKRCGIEDFTLPVELRGHVTRS